MLDGLHLSVGPLTAHEPVSRASAWDDPRTRHGLKWKWKWPAAVLGVGLIATLLAASNTPVAYIGGITLFVLIVGVTTRLVMRRRDHRRLRYALRSGQWTLVNVVMLAEVLGPEPTGFAHLMSRGAAHGGIHFADKVVAIIDPGTGDVEGTWLPFTRTHPWPGVDVRCWAWLVVSPDAREAAIATIDRSMVVGLRRGLGYTKALHDRAWNLLRVSDIPPAPGGRQMKTVEAGVRHPPDEPERWPNRPMSVRARVIIVAILTALTVAAGVSDTLAHRSKIEHREDLERNGVEARAEVVDYCSCGKSPDEIRILILDGPYAGFAGTRYVDRGPTRSPGDQVTLFHAQGDVEDLVIVGYDEDVRGNGSTLGAATIVTAIGLWITHRRAKSGIARRYFSPRSRQF